MTNADSNPSDRRGSNALDDPGTAQVLIFIGWIPPAIAALVGGVIVGLTTGSLGAFAVVAIGGTLVGYIACLTVLFTLGWFLQRLRVRGMLATAFLLLDVVVGIAGAIAIAILASIETALALQATVLVIGFVVVVIVAFGVVEARVRG